MEYVLKLYYRNPIVVMLKVGLHYQCSDSKQEVSWGSEASNEAPSQESQGGRNYDEASPWKLLGR